MLAIYQWTPTTGIPGGGLLFIFLFISFLVSQSSWGSLQEEMEANYGLETVLGLGKAHVKIRGQNGVR